MARKTAHVSIMYWKYKGNCERTVYVEMKAIFTFNDRPCDACWLSLNQVMFIDLSTFMIRAFRAFKKIEKYKWSRNF